MILNEIEGNTSVEKNLQRVLVKEFDHFRDNQKLSSLVMTLLRNII